MMTAAMEKLEKWKEFFKSIDIPDENLDDYAQKFNENGYKSNKTEVLMV